MRTLSDEAPSANALQCLATVLVLLQPSRDTQPVSPTAATPPPLEFLATMLTAMDRDDYRRVRALLEELDSLPLGQARTRLEALDVSDVVRDEVFTLLTMKGTGTVADRIHSAIRRALEAE